MGVDPGLTRCGLGCVDIDPRRRVRLVEVGVVRTPPSQSPELRLLTIARALLRKPKVLILDDSTSAVDTATDAKIRKAFREEIPGTTKIIIAQRLSSVEHADQIIVLDEGRILERGTHDELLNRCCIYREVYESQQ